MSLHYKPEQSLRSGTFRPGSVFVFDFPVSSNKSRYTMSNGAAGAMAVTTAVVARARRIQAVRAIGSIVEVSPTEFRKIINRFAEDEAPLVVVAEPSGWFAAKWQYLTNYSGLNFYTKSSDKLRFDREIEQIDSQKIWIPR
ncbi:MAG: hypothetical protein ACRCUY_04640 [Thermoguttaceae bacterium]